MLHSYRSRIVLWTVFTLTLLIGVEAHALPAFLRIFNDDPFSRTEWRNQCATCHVNPQGGGPRNNFGQAFDKNNRTITPELRAAWPDRFVMMVEAGPVDGVNASFVSGGREAIIEAGGEFFRVNPAEGKIEKITPAQVAQLKQSAGLPPAATAAASAQPAEQPLR